MNFQETGEQDMLRASLAATLARSAGNRHAAMGELGIFGLLVSEANGGSGLGMAEAAIVLQEAGRAGAGGTLAETLLLADTVCAAMPQRRDDVLSGAMTIIAPISGQLAEADGRLTGTLVLQRPGADDWVAASLATDEGVALLPASGLPPVARGRIEAVADSCELRVDVAKDNVTVLADDRFVSRLALLRCAELLGAAEHCFKLSVGYLNDRVQFGQPIGANQALKHIAADTYLSLENMRVAVEYAAAALDLEDPMDHALDVLLSYVPQTARTVAETAIHLHGGIGLTWEYGLNAYLRRIVRLGSALGAPSANRIAVYDRFMGRQEA